MNLLIFLNNFNDYTFISIIIILKKFIYNLKNNNNN